MTYFLFFIALNSSTTLVRPPFKHTYGYHRATPHEVRLLFGKQLAFKEPQKIACTRLIADNNLQTSRGDDRVTVYCTNSMASQIVYNKGITAIETYGRFGEGKGEFWWPCGIAGNPEGDVFIADVENNRIVRLKNDMDSLRWIYSIGSYGPSDSQFKEPWDLALDSDGKLWVADRGNNRLQIFGDEGEFVQEIDGFLHPIAIDLIDKKDKWNFPEEEFAVVIDNYGQRIHKLNLSGNIVLSLNLYTSQIKDGELTDCAIDYYGNIWVTDRKNSCVHKFDKELKYLDTFTDNFKEPTSIAIWKRYGQVFILSKEAIDYYWIGVNGDIRCYPNVFDPQEKGVTIVLTITERAKIKANIYNQKNLLIRELIPGYIMEPYEHNIVWDGKNDTGKLVNQGIYKIEIEMEPTYSSKGFFKKKLASEVQCKYK